MSDQKLTAVEYNTRIAMQCRAAEIAINDACRDMVAAKMVCDHVEDQFELALRNIYPLEAADNPMMR